MTLIYGSISSLAVNPIEKKPFYHFHPGTRTLTAGSWSFNFGCPWCQNWDISKSPPQLFIELVLTKNVGPPLTPLPAQKTNRFS